jgi:tetratricopeptide (TPR) repeat protein
MEADNLRELADQLEREAKRLRERAEEISGTPVDPPVSQQDATMGALAFLQASHDAATSLNGSLQEASRLGEMALATLPSDAEPVLRASAMAHLARLFYEIGTEEKLRSGLELLEEAMTTLRATDHAVDAVCLLDDQAQICLRLGFPVRAAHLLRTAREFFSERLDSEPRAREELADVEHALARLPLHVESKPGWKPKAIERAIEHGAQSAVLYDSLGLKRSWAGVQDTLAQLQLILKRPADAKATLEAALKVQRTLGDGIGMAKTVAGLADLYAHAGAIPAALDLIEESIRLNHAKGSSMGLAYNRQHLNKLRPVIEAHPPLWTKWNTLAGRLHEAQAMLQ